MTIFKREFKIAKARTSVAGADRHSSLTTIFDRVKRGFTKAKAEQNITESERHSLFVHLSDMSWEITSANTDSEKGVAKFVITVEMLKDPFGRGKFGTGDIPILI